MSVAFRLGWILAPMLAVAALPAADYVTVTSINDTQQAEGSENGLIPAVVKFTRRNSAETLQVNYRISGQARSDKHDGHISGVVRTSGGLYNLWEVSDLAGVVGGTDGQVQATGSGGRMSAVQVYDPGYGYKYPTVTVGAPPAGTSATLSAVVLAGVIQRVVVENPGQGYAMPTVVFTGGGGTGAAGRVILQNGIVTGVELTDGGYGYTSLPTVQVTSTPAPIAAAVLTPVLDNEQHRLISLQLTNGGSGYPTPSITINRPSGLAGTNAQVVATLDGGRITAATVLDGGTGYATTSSVIFPVGGATADIQISGPDFKAPLSSMASGAALVGSLTFAKGQREMTLTLTPKRNGAGGARTTTVSIEPPTGPNSYGYSTSVDGAVLVSFADVDDQAKLTMTTSTASLRPNTIPSDRSNLPVAVQGMAEWFCEVTGDNRARRVDVLVGGTAQQTMDPASPQDYYLVFASKPLLLTTNDYLFVNPEDTSVVPQVQPPKSGDTAVAVSKADSNHANSAPGALFSVNDVVVLEAPGSGIHVVTAITLPQGTKNQLLTLAPAISANTTYGLTRVRKIGSLNNGNQIMVTGNGSFRFWAIPGPNATPRGSKTVELTVAQTNDYQVVSPASQTATVADTTVYASLAHISNAGKPSIGGKAQIRLSRSFPVDVRAQYKVLDSSTAVSYDGTNPAVGDYILTGLDQETMMGEVTIPAGQTSVDILLTPRMREGSLPEVVSTVDIMLMPSLDFLLSNSDNSFSNPTVSLEIAPPLYTNKGSLVYVAAVKLQDGAEGASPISGKIRVKLSQPDGSGLADSTEWLDQDLSISFAVTNSPGCVPGVDYSNTLVDPTASLGSVTIPRGSQYADIVIPVFDDTEVEATETISIQLEAGTGFQLSTTPSAAVSILDDEPVLTVRKVADATESGTLGSFVVDIASSLPRRLDFTFTLGGTAVEGTDYATITHAGSISAGETTSVPISIAAIRDADYDNNETVTIDIVASPTVYTLGATQSASLYIVDDIALLEVDATASVNPRERGLVPGSIRVVNRNTTTTFGAIAFTYTVAGAAAGVATPGNDYVALSGTATIPAGASSVDIPVVPLAETPNVYDPDETVTITLMPSGATPPVYMIGAGATGGVTIGDDTIPTLTIGTQGVPVEGGDTASFVVSASFAPSTDISVSVEWGGTATLSTDYTRSSATVTIPAGQTSASVVITALADDIVDVGETVTLTLKTDVASPATYLLGAPSTATLTITNVNQDTPPPPVTYMQPDGGGGGCGVGSGLGSILVGAGLALAATLRRRQRRAA